MQLSLIIIFFTGILFSTLAIPLIRRKVKMNSWYGVRIPQTSESEYVWYEVNSKVGKYLFGFGLLISCLSLYFFSNPTNPEYLMIYVLIVMLIFGSVFLIIRAYKIADQISADQFIKQKDK